MVGYYFDGEINKIECAEIDIGTRVLGRGYIASSVESLIDYYVLNWNKQLKEASNIGTFDAMQTVERCKKYLKALSEAEKKFYESDNSEK